MPTKLAENVTQGRLLACCIGFAVPGAFSRMLLAPFILIGLTLLAYQKDLRYPRLRWTAAMRMYRQTHRWHPWCVVGSLALCCFGLSALGDGTVKGLFQLSLGIYSMLYFGASVSQLDQPALGSAEAE